MLSRDYVGEALGEPTAKKVQADDIPLPCGPEDYGLPAAEVTVKRARDELGSPYGEPEREGRDGKAHVGAPEALPYLDIRAWDDKPVPPRAWAVKDRIPLRQPTLLSGEGAIGKTLLLLQQSAAHALDGRDWLGMLPEPGPAMYLGCEDEQDEIHRRLADIAAHYGVRFADLAENLHLLSYAGQDALLGVTDRRGIVQPTPLFERLHADAIRIRPKLIGIDTASDVFAGDENNRAEVRQFVGLLRKMAIDANAAVVLCSHPSLTGITSGSGLSGSTGWHNSVRARLYFKKATTADGDEPDADLRELHFMKSNYGPLGDRILLRWRQGVYVPEPSGSNLTLGARA
jgi:RecA-family ATPase